MPSSIVQKTVSGLVVIVLIGVFGYMTYSKIPDSSIDTLGIEGVASNGAGQEVLTIVEQLEQVSISSKIFSIPLFANLKDFSIPIVPESHGRANPFSPVDSDAGFSSGTVSRP